MRQGDDATTVQAAGQQANPVAERILQASRHTGVSFGYLMAQAGRESAFRAEAGSRASSASGLFQFTKGTWLQLVRQHGAALGLGDLADSIHRTASGGYAVDDPAIRQTILDLRRDPRISALLAGEYANENKAYLEKQLGRPVNGTELYLAHFLGPAGAARLLKAQAANPAQAAAALLPEAARKNPSIFYGSGHSARSVAAVYDRVNHAIERPMKRYAALDEPAAPRGGPAGAKTAGHHHGRRHGAEGIAVASATPPSPYDAGGWPSPEAMAPGANPEPSLALPAAFIADPPVPDAPAEAAGARAEQVAYTDASESADRISGRLADPRPAAPPDEGANLFGRLLSTVRRSLFG